MQDFLQISLLETSGFSGLLALSCIILVASIIRGYSGFGFSAIVVAGASLFMPTREVVPVVIILEVIASLQMAVQVWKHVQWRMILSILATSVFLIPLGQHVLLWIDVELMRVIAAILLLAVVILTAIGRSFPIRNNLKGWFLIGIVSGFMNGLLAMGGMWAIILLLGSGIKIADVRASLVALLFTTGSYAVLTGVSQGLVTSTTWGHSILALPVLFIGVWIGSRKFEDSNADTYRKVVLWILSTLSITLLLRAFWVVIKSQID